MIRSAPREPSVISWTLEAGLFLVACGKGGPGPNRAAEGLVARLDTAYFRVFASLAPDSVVQGVADSLETARTRLLADLTVPATRSTTGPPEDGGGFF